MNATTHKIVSTILALVSIFGLLAGAFGIKDALAVKDFMTAGEGDPVAELTDGLKQLKENEAAYTDGVIQYKDGEVQLADGAVQLADGEVQLADGKRQLADGEKQLAQGYRDYAAGQKQLADGQRQIDENTAAYKEGKATLAKIEPIIPYLNQYIAFRDGTIAKLPGFETAQEWFMAVVRPLMKKLGLFDIPNDVKDLPRYVTEMVKDGKAQLKQYEDGLKQLADGKRQLAEGKKQLQDGERQLADGRRQVAQGEKDLAQGYADYADGEQQLKDGRKQLAQFEDGMVQVADGLKEILSQKSYAYKNGTVVVNSPADTLGKDFDFYKKGKDGKNIKMLNGESYVDLDQATLARDALAKYVDDMTGSVTKEIVSRLATSALLILGSLIGLIAAIRGLLKTKGFVPGVIAAVLGLAALIGGFATKFTDRVFLLEDGGATGGLQVWGIVLFALAACLFALVTYFTREKKVKDVTVEPIEE